MIDKTKIENGATLILEGIGADIKDPNFRGTPRRVARMFAEMLSPPRRPVTVFPAHAADLVILRRHRLIALCPHHLQPVEIYCNVAYIPAEHTIGLSKLARIAAARLTRPILQEDLAHEIAEEINNIIRPKGVGVVLVGSHGCMRFRGVKTTGDVITSVMKGVLLLNPSARQEFLNLIGVDR